MILPSWASWGAASSAWRGVSLSSWVCLLLLWVSAGAAFRRRRRERNPLRRLLQPLLLALGRRRLVFHHGGFVFEHNKYGSLKKLGKLNMYRDWQSIWKSRHILLRFQFLSDIWFLMMILSMKSKKYRALEILKTDV